MPAISPAQTSFAGGELSPRARGRFDSEVYGRSLSYDENFEPCAQGSILMRGGTQYVASLGGDARNRLIPFRTASGQDYVAVVTHALLRLYTEGGELLGGALAELVVNGTFSPAGGSWTVASGAPAFPGGYAKLFDVDSITQLLTAAAGTTNVQIAVKVTQIHNVTGDEPRFAQPNVLVTQGGVPIGALYPTGTGVWTTTVAAVAGNLTIQLDNLGGDVGTWWCVTEVSVKAGNTAAVSLVAPWTAEQLAAVQFAPHPAADATILVHPNVEPRVLARDAGTGAWSLTAISAMGGYQGAPANWTGTNWPAAVEIWQNRLWLAGTPDARNRVWASRSGSLYDFRTATGPGTPATVLASDGLDLSISTKGGIAWMHGQGALLIGTDLGEYQLTSSTGAVTPLDVHVVPQSAYGVLARQAVAGGDQVLYASRDGRKVRAIGFVADEEAWVSRDVTFAAEHLTKDGIKELHYADPNCTIVSLLEAGWAASCTYQRAEQVAAWWRLTLSAPVLSAAVADGTNGSVLFLCVQRAGGNYLEVLPMADTADRFYVDSAKRGVLGADGTFSGLAHLNGETVRVIVRGALEADQVVAAGVVQAITAERIADDPTLVGAEVVVGLPYTVKAVTLPPEGGNPRGSAQGAKRRRPRIVVRLNNSAIPLINGQRPPVRTPATPQDEAEPLFTGDVEVRDLGWGDGTVTIEQDLPFRTEILAIFGTEQVNQI